MEKAEIVSYLKKYCKINDELESRQEQLEKNKNLLRHYENEQKKINVEKLKYHSLDEPLDKSVSNLIWSMAASVILGLVVTIPLVFILNWIFHITNALYLFTNWAFFDEHRFWTKIILAVLLSLPFSYPLTISLEKEQRREDVKQL